jgi:hypothetical protein
MRRLKYKLIGTGITLISCLKPMLDADALAMQKNKRDKNI